MSANPDKKKVIAKPDKKAVTAEPETEPVDPPRATPEYSINMRTVTDSYDDESDAQDNK